MTGLDISGPLIREGLSKHPGLNLIHWDNKTLPFKSASLDAALLECSFSVMGFCERLLDECADILRMDGKLIISDIFSKKEVHNSSLPTFTWLESRLVSAGFTIETSEDHTPALVTYVAELSGQCSLGFDMNQLLCTRYAAGFKVSDHCYRLIIARNVRE